MFGKQERIQYWEDNENGLQKVLGGMHIMENL